MKTYSSGSGNYSGSESQFNSTSSYVVLSSPMTGSGDYKANFTETFSSPPETGILWIEPNGTVIAVDIAGQNFTGAAAAAHVGVLTFSFPNIYFYGADIEAYLALPGVHQLNQTSLTLGPTTLTVTNYGITSPSSFCNGSGLLVDNSFLIQAGKVPGTTATLVTLWSSMGYFKPNSGPTIASSSMTAVTYVVAA
jgi:hypothetical protein